MNKRIIIAAIAALVLFIVVIIVACTPHKKLTKGLVGGDQITLTYWRTLDDKEVFDPVVEEYQRDHPNIKIEYKKLEQADYEKNLLEALAAGRGPDMFSLNNYWMPRYFDKVSPVPDKMLSINDYKKAFFPVVLKDNVKANRIYGVPFYVDTLALFSNTDILANADISDPPVTWPDLEKNLPKLNNRQGNTFNQSAISLGTPNIDRAPDILSLLMLQNKTTMVNDNRDQALFNLKQTVDEKADFYGTKALDYYTSYANPKTTRYSWNASLGDSIQAFASGKTAYMVGYSYDIPQLEKLNPNLHYTINPIPQVSAGEPVDFANYWSETVSKSSPHQQEAWDFITYVASRAHLGVYTEAARKVPSRVDVPPIGQLRPFYDQNAKATSWYKGDVAKVDPVFQTMIAQVLQGDVPQRAADEGANQVTNILRAMKNGVT